MYEEERRRLVRRLSDHGYVRSASVLEAMERVPRHEFLPPDMWDAAYVDSPLSIGEGQTISAPHMVGMMLEALDLRPGMKVLEIGTGSGYHASLLGELVRPGGKVYTVERIETLGLRAKEALDRMGYGDVVEVIISDGTNGLPQHAPYDRILVTAAAPHVPGPLKEQLADGGILLIPVGGWAYQELMVIVRRGEDYEEAPLGSVIFVPLIGEHGHRA